MRRQRTLAPAGARPVRPDDRAKFVRLANKRVPRALDAIRLVGNLSTRTNYSFTQEDAAAVIEALKRAVAACETRFAGVEPAIERFRLD